MWWGCAWIVPRRQGRAGAEGVRTISVTSTVFVLELAAEGDFRQRSEACRIRGVDGHRWREGVPR